MILTDGFMYVLLDTFYIFTYTQSVFNNLNLENDVTVISFFGRPLLISYLNY